MDLNNLEILEDDFDLFVALDNIEKVEFLFDAIEIGTEAATIKQEQRLLENIESGRPKVKVEDFQIGNHRICVTLSKSEVHLNSSSLKAIKVFTNKMFNDGLILQSLKIKKSIFDMYRFFKAYKLVGRAGPISSN
tara:strand:+ start:114 stop:518 length:405 start_codon:yes stop_codon:yes gene_type:complete